MARAETFRRVGDLAGSFFAYYEDTDWCWRARLAGLSVRYEPAGVVHHVGGASTGGPFSARVQFLAARNRVHMLARNAPLAVVGSELRSPVDRPASGMALPLARRVSRGLLERRREPPRPDAPDQRTRGSRNHATRLGAPSREAPASTPCGVAARK